MTSDREAVKTFQRILGAAVLVPVNPKKTNRAPLLRGLSRSLARRAMNPTDEAKVEDGFGTDYSNAFTKRSTVNVTTPPPMDQQQGDDWPDEEPTQAPAVSYPEEEPNRQENHIFTWSPKLPDGSMLVIRSNSAAGLLAATEAVAGVAAQLATAWGNVKTSTQGFQQAMQQQYQQSGYGQQPSPTAQPVAQAYPTPPQPGPMQPPNQPYQGQPDWQQAGASQRPADIPQGWYKLNVSFKAKAGFDAIVASNGVRKADPGQGGQVSFRTQPVKSWYCSPEVVALFGQYQPVPA